MQKHWKDLAALIAIISVALVVTACGNSAPTKVAADMNIVDQNQSISRENATLNARRYAAEVYPGADTRVVMQSDSSVKSDCRFGDGWASGDLMDNRGVKIDSLKCQTNGSGKGTFGCMPNKTFATKDYAAEDGKCNTAITALDKFK